MLVAAYWTPTEPKRLLVGGAINIASLRDETMRRSPQRVVYTSHGYRLGVLKVSPWRMSPES